jgi:hypothetical protein
LNACVSSKPVTACDNPSAAYTPAREVQDFCTLLQETASGRELRSTSSVINLGNAQPCALDGAAAALQALHHESLGDVLCFCSQHYALDPQAQPPAHNLNNTRKHWRHATAEAVEGSLSG